VLGKYFIVADILWANKRWWWWWWYA